MHILLIYTSPELSDSPGAEELKMKNLHIFNNRPFFKNIFDLWNWNFTAIMIHVQTLDHKIKSEMTKQKVHNVLRRNKHDPAVCSTDKPFNPSFIVFCVYTYNTGGRALCAEWINLESWEVFQQHRAKHNRSVPARSPRACCCALWCTFAQPIVTKTTVTLSSSTQQKDSVQFNELYDTSFPPSPWVSHSIQQLWGPWKESSVVEPKQSST